MGVPGSPVYDQNLLPPVVDNLNFVDELNHNDLSSYKPGPGLGDGGQISHVSFNKHFLIDGADLAAQNRRLVETDDNFFYNRSSQSPVYSSSCSTTGSVNNSNENSLDRLLMTSSATERMQISGQTERYFGMEDSDSASATNIDRSPIDFRRNFAAIERAAKEGGGLLAQDNSYISGRRSSTSDIDGKSSSAEIDDPYSYYWSAERYRPDRLRFVSDELIGDGQVRSPDSHDSGIHVDYAGSLPKPQENLKECSESIEIEEKKLPSGWEKHEDAGGFSYYWHVDSGTVQREHPSGVESSNDPVIDKRDSTRGPRHSRTFDSAADFDGHSSTTTATRSPSLVTEQSFKQTTVVKKLVENLQSSTEERSEDGLNKDKANDVKNLALNLPVRFAVRSLGWTEVNDEDLTPERSSRAVNKAIIDLSTGRKDLIDNVSKWGDGKELILELDDRDLRLIDPESGAVLHTQLIYQIRVWGVGRDNGRDFAYVARDRLSRRYMCHVFRCDTPARTIANTLRDICKRLMVEQRRPSSFHANGHAGGVERRKSQRRQSEMQLPRSSSGGHSTKESFPAPMEEPKKIIRCHFLGVTQVTRATGIDVLNEAVDRLVNQVREDRWILVDVSISPSTISIVEVGNNQIAECRVRYLSFLGIGRDIKHCAFIMQSSSDSYMCYVFHVDPSAGAMAKTIEAACKLRYQKVLDAHGERRPAPVSKGWTETIRDVFGSFTGKRSSRGFSLYPR